MEESKEAFLIRKKLAIAELMAKAEPIMEQLADAPELDAAIDDRIAHIERYASLFMQLEMILSQIERIKSTSLDEQRANTGSRLTITPRQ